MFFLSCRTLSYLPYLANQIDEFSRGTPLTVRSDKLTLAVSMVSISRTCVDYFFRFLNIGPILSGHCAIVDHTEAPALDQLVPSEHNTFSLRWVNVGPASKTLAQH